MSSTVLFSFTCRCRLVRNFRLSIIVTGVLTAQDALRATEAGASGIIVSNDGGRQLDRVPAAIEALPEIVNAVGNRVEVHLEGAGLDGTQVSHCIRSWCAIH